MNFDWLGFCRGGGARLGSISCAWIFSAPLIHSNEQVDMQMRPTIRLQLLIYLFFFKNLFIETNKRTRENARNRNCGRRGPAPSLALAPPLHSANDFFATGIFFYCSNSTHLKRLSIFHAKMAGKWRRRRRRSLLHHQFRPSDAFFWVMEGSALCLWDSHFTRLFFSPLFLIIIIIIIIHLISDVEDNFLFIRFSSAFSGPGGPIQRKCLPPFPSSFSYSSIHFFLFFFLKWKLDSLFTDFNPRNGWDRWHHHHVVNQETNDIPIRTEFSQSSANAADWIQKTHQNHNQNLKKKLIIIHSHHDTPSS